MPELLRLLQQFILPLAVFPRRGHGLAGLRLEPLRFLQPTLFFALPLRVSFLDRFDYLVELPVPLPDGLLGRHGTRRGR